MQIKKWTKPNSDEVRYYISCKFGGGKFLDYRSNLEVDGAWIGKDQDGAAHLFKKKNGLVTRFEMDYLDKPFDLTTFAKWEEDFSKCLTASGNWSEAKFLKLC